MSPEPRDIVGAVLPGGWSQLRRDNVAEQILDALVSAGLLTEYEVTTVGVGNALVPVETVEQFGLVIRLDAMGEASEISSDRGLVVIE